MFHIFSIPDVSLGNVQRFEKFHQLSHLGALVADDVEATKESEVGHKKLRSNVFPLIFNDEILIA
jgi:hypothetical protein